MWFAYKRAGDSHALALSHRQLLREVVESIAETDSLGTPSNAYVSRRVGSGWITASALAPHRIISHPNVELGIDGCRPRPDASYSRATKARHRDC